MHLSSSTIAAKTVVAVPCPGEGNDPIFTEVVESKSSVNLSAPTAAPIHYAKHYPTIPLCQALSHYAKLPPPIHPLIPSKQQSLNKSNICSLKQALDGRILQCHNHWKDLCMHLKSLSICIIANYRVENTGSCQPVKRHTKNVSKRPNFKMSA